MAAGVIQGEGISPTHHSQHTLAEFLEAEVVSARPRRPGIALLPAIVLDAGYGHATLSLSSPRHDLAAMTYHGVTISSDEQGRSLQLVVAGGGEFSHWHGSYIVKLGNELVTELEPGAIRDRCRAARLSIVVAAPNAGVAQVQCRAFAQWHETGHAAAQGQFQAVWVLHMVDSRPRLLWALVYMPQVPTATGLARGDVMLWLNGRSLVHSSEQECRAQLADALNLPLQQFLATVARADNPPMASKAVIVSGSTDPVCLDCLRRASPRKVPILPGISAPTLREAVSYPWNGSTVQDPPAPPALATPRHQVVISALGSQSPLQPESIDASGAPFSRGFNRERIAVAPAFGETANAVAAFGSIAPQRNSVAAQVPWADQLVQSLAWRAGKAYGRIVKALQETHGGLINRLAQWDPQGGGIPFVSTSPGSSALSLQIQLAAAAVNGWRMMPPLPVSSDAVSARLIAEHEDAGAGTDHTLGAGRGCFDADLPGDSMWSVERYRHMSPIALAAVASEPLRQAQRQLSARQGRCKPLTALSQLSVAEAQMAGDEARGILAKQDPLSAAIASARAAAARRQLIRRLRGIAIDRVTGAQSCAPTEKAGTGSRAASEVADHANNRAGAFEGGAASSSPVSQDTASGVRLLVHQGTRLALGLPVGPAARAWHSLLRNHRLSAMDHWRSQHPSRTSHFYANNPVLHAGYAGAIGVKLRPAGGGLQAASPCDNCALLPKDHSRTMVGIVRSLLGSCMVQPRSRATVPTHLRAALASAGYPFSHAPSYACRHLACAYPAAGCVAFQSAGELMLQCEGCGALLHQSCAGEARSANRLPRCSVCMAHVYARVCALETETHRRLRYLGLSHGSRTKAGQDLLAATLCETMLRQVTPTTIDRPTGALELLQSAIAEANVLRLRRAGRHQSQRHVTTSSAQPPSATPAHLTAPFQPVPAVAKPRLTVRQLVVCQFQGCINVLSNLLTLACRVPTARRSFSLQELSRARPHIVKLFPYATDIASALGGKAPAEMLQSVRHPLSEAEEAATLESIAGRVATALTIEGAVSILRSICEKRTSAAASSETSPAAAAVWAAELTGAIRSMSQSVAIKCWKLLNDQLSAELCSLGVWAHAWSGQRGGRPLFGAANSPWHSRAVGQVSSAHSKGSRSVNGDDLFPVVGVRAAAAFVAELAKHGLPEEVGCFISDPGFAVVRIPDACVTAIEEAARLEGGDIDWQVVRHGAGHSSLFGGASPAESPPTAERTDRLDHSPPHSDSQAVRPPRYFGLDPWALAAAPRLCALADHALSRDVSLLRAVSVCQRVLQLQPTFALVEPSVTSAAETPDLYRGDLWVPMVDCLLRGSPFTPLIDRATYPAAPLDLLGRESATAACESGSLRAAAIPRASYQALPGKAVLQASLAHVTVGGSGQLVGCPLLATLGSDSAIIAARRFASAASVLPGQMRDVVSTIRLGRPVTTPTPRVGVPSYFERYLDLPGATTRNLPSLRFDCTGAPIQRARGMEAIGELTAAFAALEMARTDRCLADAAHACLLWLLITRATSTSRLALEKRSGAETHSREATFGDASSELRRILAGWAPERVEPLPGAGPATHELQLSGACQALSLLQAAGTTQTELRWAVDTCAAGLRTELKPRPAEALGAELPFVDPVPRAVVSGILERSRLPQLPVHLHTMLGQLHWRNRGIPAARATANCWQRLTAEDVSTIAVLAAASSLPADAASSPSGVPQQQPLALETVVACSTAVEVAVTKASSMSAVLAAVHAREALRSEEPVLPEAVDWELACAWALAVLAASHSAARLGQNVNKLLTTLDALLAKLGLSDAAASGELAYGRLGAAVMAEATRRVQLGDGSGGMALVTHPTKAADTDDAIDDVAEDDEIEAGVSSVNPVASTPLPRDRTTPRDRAAQTSASSSFSSNGSSLDLLAVSPAEAPRSLGELALPLLAENEREALVAAVMVDSSVIDKPPDERAHQLQEQLRSAELTQLDIRQRAAAKTVLPLAAMRQAAPLRGSVAEVLINSALATRRLRADMGMLPPPASATASQLTRPAIRVHTDGQSRTNQLSAWSVLQATMARDLVLNTETGSVNAAADVTRIAGLLDSQLEAMARGLDDDQVRRASKIVADVPTRQALDHLGVAAMTSRPGVSRSSGLMPHHRTFADATRPCVVPTLPHVVSSLALLRLRAVLARQAVGLLRLTAPSRMQAAVTATVRSEAEAAGAAADHAVRLLDAAVPYDPRRLTFPAHPQWFGRVAASRPQSAAGSHHATQLAAGASTTRSPCDPPAGRDVRELRRRWQAASPSELPGSGAEGALCALPGCLGLSRAGSRYCSTACGLLSAQSTLVRALGPRGCNVSKLRSSGGGPPLRAEIAVPARRLGPLRLLRRRRVLSAGMLEASTGTKVIAGRRHAVGLASGEWTSRQELEAVVWTWHALRRCLDSLTGPVRISGVAAQVPRPTTGKITHAPLVIQGEHTAAPPASGRRTPRGVGDSRALDSVHISLARFLQPSTALAHPCVRDVGGNLAHSPQLLKDCPVCGSARAASHVHSHLLHCGIKARFSRVQLTVAAVSAAAEHIATLPAAADATLPPVAVPADAINGAPPPVMPGKQLGSQVPCGFPLNLVPRVAPATATTSGVSACLFDSRTPADWPAPVGIVAAIAGPDACACLLDLHAMPIPRPNPAAAAAATSGGRTVVQPPPPNGSCSLPSKTCRIHCGWRSSLHRRIATGLALTTDRLQAWLQAHPAAQPAAQGSAQLPSSPATLYRIVSSVPVPSGHTQLLPDISGTVADAAPSGLATASLLEIGDDSDGSNPLAADLASSGPSETERGGHHPMVSAAGIAWSPEADENDSLVSGLDLTLGTQQCTAADDVLASHHVIPEAAPPLGLELGAGKDDDDWMVAEQTMPHGFTLEQVSALEPEDVLAGQLPVSLPEKRARGHEQAPGADSGSKRLK